MQVTFYDLQFLTNPTSFGCSSSNALEGGPRRSRQTSKFSVYPLEYDSPSHFTSLLPQHVEHVSSSRGDKYFSPHVPGRRKSSGGTGDLLGKPHHVCPHCSYRALSRSKLVVHLRSHSGEKPFACHVCFYRSINRGNLTAHLRTHAGEEPYQCKVCHYKAKYRREFLEHMRGQHGGYL